MQRIWLLTLGILALSLLNSCMTVRDRVALRLGLPTYEQKQLYESQYHDYLLAKYSPRVERFDPIPRERTYIAGRTRTRDELTVSWSYPELVERRTQRYRHEQNSRQDKSKFYALEKESARLQWEATLLRMEADRLHKELASLDEKWNSMTRYLAKLERDRSRVQESVAKLDTELNQTYDRLELLEAERSRLVSR